jgi:protein-L-isoaspartate(D-aspartate) O-methyltransferase
MDSSVSVIDYAAARNLMVDGQVRPNKVNDARILDAMRRLPRERFLPPGLAALAYADQDVKLPGGRVLIEPMVIARLAQLLAIRGGERALVVGAGTGYGACLLAACGASVTALEEDEALLAIARGVLPQLAPGVSLVSGPLAGGWKPFAPYDAILIEGAVTKVPDAIATQLNPRVGRLVAVRIASGRVGQAVLAEPVESAPGSVALSFQPRFDCATPTLPGFGPQVGFVF